MRVAICQPMIPAYRLPLFERLGALPEIELTVFAGASQGSLQAYHRGTAFEVVAAPVRRFGFGMRAQMAQLLAVKRDAFDLIILPWDVHYLTLWPSIALAHFFGIPVILWGHGYSQHPRALNDAARNWCGKMADGVLLYTRSVAAQLIGDAGFSPSRVFIAQNALDQDPIQAARRHWLERPKELRAFQESVGIDPDATILFISRLESGNRIDLLLQATLALSKDFPTLKTVLIGDGRQRADLEAMAKALGVEGRVIFVGAIYEEMRLAPLMLSASLFCYPINIGLSLLHAFGYGLPAVTSGDRRSQNPEIEALIADENGLEYRSGDLQDMIEQCARILRDGALRQRLSAAALRTAVMHYSLDHMVAGFEQVFRWAAGTVPSISGRRG